MNINFVENATKKKPLMLLVAIISYILFVGLFVVALLYNFNVIKTLPDADFFFPGSLYFLSIAIYCTWACCSEYLKFYFVISADEIIFYYNKKQEKFNVEELIGYQILKKSNWLWGGYWTIKLIFNKNQTFNIKTFKGKELESVLNEIIKNKN
ncbi:MAG: hypothetical protein IKK20_00480 [Clostridia bacterium]|nr:hypothetical protein [Clostridia bacterium]